MKSVAAKILSGEIRSDFVLISAFTSTATLMENTHRTNELRNELAGYDLMHTELTDSYKGKIERSFLVLISDDVDVRNLLRIARRFDQESILVSQKDTVQLLFPTAVGHTWEKIGTRFEPGFGTEDAWTKTACGRFYVVAS